jgi:uncharacterized protein
MTDAEFPPLIQALTEPSRYAHPVDRVQVLQTHISWVILTGRYAYKIKKPLDLGFLNFTTLERRRINCEEELRLNRRLAPDLYLKVMAISGTPEAPILDGTGEAIEYAVQMKEFPQEAQLDRVLARGELTAEHIDALALRLVAFHRDIPKAPEASPFGGADRIARPVLDNFDTVRTQITDPKERTGLDHLEAWTRKTHEAFSSRFEERKQKGFVRECHGDVHLGNMAMVDGKITIFDCIEFSENLRWIDVISEIAFLAMDLEDRGRPDYSNRLLNQYLEETGDYAALALLRYYQAYRAMVRAKVTSIRLGQPGIGPDEQERIQREYRTYETLAEHYSRPADRWLAITHGLSGSGKSRVAQWMAGKTGSIRIRTDVERKRLFGFAPTVRTSSGIDSGVYTDEANRKTYGKMAELSETILSAGFPVIADGAFLKHDQRRTLRGVAEKARVPFVILDVHAPEPTLIQRIEDRSREGKEVSEADLSVLKHQIETREPLGDAEKQFAIRIKTDPEFKIEPLLDSLQRIVSKNKGVTSSK